MNLVDGKKFNTDSGETASVQLVVIIITWSPCRSCRPRNWGPRRPTPFGWRDPKPPYLNKEQTFVCWQTKQALANWTELKLCTYKEMMQKNYDKITDLSALLASFFAFFCCIFITFFNLMLPKNMELSWVRTYRYLMNIICRSTWKSKSRHPYRTF